MKTAILATFPLLATALVNPSPKGTPPSQKPVIAGSTPPFENFDPLSLSNEKNIAFFREAELKHGRLGMVAATSFPLIEQYTHAPAINEFQKLDEVSQMGIITAMLGVEFYSMLTGWEPPTMPFTLRKDYQPGDLGLGLMKDFSSDKSIDLQNKELNNGRLAMIAAAGMMAQELLTGQPIIN